MAVSVIYQLQVIHIRIADDNIFSLVAFDKCLCGSVKSTSVINVRHFIYLGQIFQSDILHVQLFVYSVLLGDKIYELHRSTYLIHHQFKVSKEFVGGRLAEQQTVLIFS